MIPGASALTAALKRKAHEEGFDAVGIARAERLERDAEMLRAWLRRDYHATMAWMARDPERRADPRAVLPGCRSVVVAAMNYYPGAHRAGTPAGRARVALYARGRDYHRILGRRLRRLARWLEETGGGRSRVYVDTGPVLERAWAERAGVGWIGKNANLLRRDMGSWLLLGEILTTLELEPDPGPHPDHCGSCTACLDACPTGAIVEPGVVDSWRCISYWTIEHRGAVPEPHRASLGEWIFGCDICQDVCPWNQRFAVARQDTAFGWREDLQGLDPLEVLAMDEAAFRKRFAGTALMRARWDGMRRNAVLVLAHRRDPASAEALQRAAADADPIVRGHAQWALAARERGVGPLASLRSGRHIAEGTSRGLRGAAGGPGSRKAMSRRGEGAASVRASERRRTKRARRRLMVRYGTRKPDKTAFTRNISDTGMFLQTNSVLPPGTTLQVQLELLGRSFTMWARVVWAKKSPPELAHVLGSGMGLCFIEPPAEWLDTYERWARGH